MSTTHIPEPAFPLGATEAAMYASCIEDLNNLRIDLAERAHLTAKAKALCGLTKQEYFAAKALSSCFQDFLNDMEKSNGIFDEFWREEVAEGCYAMADALLKEGAQRD
jgi:hypothetical protein